MTVARITRRAALAGGAAAVCAGRAAAAGPGRLMLGPAEPLPAGLWGFNSNILTATAFRGMTYGDPRFTAAVAAFAPRVLRFPGGTIANNYRWREDSFSEPAADKTGWAGEQLRLFRKIGRPYDLPGFAAVCRRFDAEPVWVLNVYEETPDSVAALCGRWDELGLAVRRVEFANEPYWDGRSFLNVHRYAELCRPLAAALRAARPAVRVGACFGPARRGGYDYAANWNAVLGGRDWFDAAVYHEYHGGQGFALEAGDTLAAAELLRPERLIDEGLAALDAAAPGVPVWFTEWNVGQEGLKAWKNRGAELLFLAAAVCRLVDRRDRIELACFHNLYEQLFGTFWLEDGSDVPRRNASWDFFRLLAAAWRSAEALRPLRGLPADGDVIGFGTSGEQGVRLFLANRGATVRSFPVPADLPAGAVRHTLRCPPDTELPTDAPLIEPVPLAGGSVTLPPHSVCLLAEADALEVDVPAPAAANLFPPRPHLTLWHEPSAAAQPRFDAAGVYELNLSGLTEKAVAVVTMDLSHLSLRPGAAYALTFEARADPAAGLIADGPDAAEGTFLPLLPDFAPHRLSFTFDPAANGGNVTLVLPRETLAGGGRVALRGFRLAAVP